MFTILEDFIFKDWFYVEDLNKVYDSFCKSIMSNFDKVDRNKNVIISNHELAQQLNLLGSKNLNLAIIYLNWQTERLNGILFAKDARTNNHC